MATRTRKEILREYFLEAMREFCARGAVARRAGEPLDQVLRREWSVALGQLAADVVEVGRDIGTGMVQGLVQGLIGSLLTPGKPIQR